MTRRNTTEAREDFSTLINQVAFGKERVILHRRGKDVAAIVPLEDLRLLERLIEEAEDRLDIDEAERILADPAEKPVPWEQARKELGLD